MRVYQINTYSGVGGAGIAVKRLNKGLLSAGIESEVYSVDRSGPGENQDKFIPPRKTIPERLWSRWRQFQLNSLRQRNRPRPSSFDLFAYDLSCHGMALLKACEGADLINLHWVCDLLDYPYVLPRLRPDVPVVWTLHDLNPGTGGCFYPMECTAFHSVCGDCPQLGSGQEKDMSTEIWNRKAKALRSLRPKLSLVTPSEWLAGQVRQSSLLRDYPVQAIANSVDTTIFRLRDRRSEKLRLGLDPDRPVALFVAAVLDNPWKGLRYLLEAIPMVLSKHPQTQFVAIGKIDQTAGWPSEVKGLGLRSNEEEMAQIYASADLLIVPSVADNFPNVILEAMACGVPAVGFVIGGVPEMIREGETGVLAKEISPPGLAAAIGRLLQGVMSERESWSARCRERAVREFSLDVQARRYQILYQSLLQS